MYFKKIALLVTSIIVITAANAQYKLVFNDNFNKRTLNTTYWNIDTGCKWYNNEAQCYTNTNINIKKGKLQLIAKKQQQQQKNYTSARINTQHKFSFTYGKISIRAKMPLGNGTWPALWMLPETNQYGNWPKSGEMDIVEYVGYDSTTLHCTMHTACCNHTKGTQVTNTIYMPNATNTFHVYTLEWTKDTIKGFVDDTLYYTYINKKEGTTQWPFDKPFYLIINLAIGGDWGGKNGIDDTIFPTIFEVDWVKVYQKTEMP